MSPKRPKSTVMTTVFVTEGAGSGGCAHGGGAGAGEPAGSSTQNCQPSGAGPQAGSGVQPSGGTQPAGGCGQFGGGTNRCATEPPHVLRADHGSRSCAAFRSAGEPSCPRTS